MYFLWLFFLITATSFIGGSKASYRPVKLDLESDCAVALEEWAEIENHRQAIETCIKETKSDYDDYYKYKSADLCVPSQSEFVCKMWMSLAYSFANHDISIAWCVVKKGGFLIADDTLFFFPIYASELLDHNAVENEHSASMICYNGTATYSEFYEFHKCYWVDQCKTLILL